MANSRLCSIPGCGKRVKARGWCSSHYCRWAMHGDPIGGGTHKGDAMRYYLDVVLVYHGSKCLIWPFARDSQGYGVVRSGGKSMRVHRKVCEAVNGPPQSPDHEAAHSCGKGHEGCCTRRHLEWKTKKENADDRLIHGTHNRGERQWGAKITEAQAREILALKGLIAQRHIAEMFSVSISIVGSIHSRRTWSWL